MNAYLVLKGIHIGTVTISGLLFVLRGLWMMREPERLRIRWVRVLPHVNDTVLLASAIALVVTTRQYPFVQDWLTAKVLALAVYILLGSIALRYGRTRRLRIVAWLGALVVFAYIVMVGCTRDARLGLL